MLYASLRAVMGAVGAVGAVGGTVGGAGCCRHDAASLQWYNVPKLTNKLFISLAFIKASIYDK